MRSFKRLLVLIIALALAAAVVFFVLENRTPTQLMFLDWQTPQLPLALFVMSAFVLGLLLGPLISWWPQQRLRMRCNKQAKQLKAYEQEIKTLKNATAGKDLAVSPGEELAKAS